MIHQPAVRRLDLHHLCSFPSHNGLLYYRLSLSIFGSQFFPVPSCLTATAQYNIHKSTARCHQGINLKQKVTQGSAITDIDMLLAISAGLAAGWIPPPTNNTYVGLRQVLLLSLTLHRLL